MIGAVVVEVAVRVASPASAVWAEASTPDGVNGELMPLVRIKFPTSVSALTSADIVSGCFVGRCWMLAGGVFPFDRHSLTFESIRDDPDAEAMGFVEESTSLLQRRWRHERTLTVIDEHRCEVRDRVTVVPRLGMARPLVARIVPWVFAHRHRQLIRRWGTAG